MQTLDVYPTGQEQGFPAPWVTKPTSHLGARPGSSWAGWVSSALAQARREPHAVL